MAARFSVHHYDSLLATRGAPGGNKAGIVHLDGGFPSDQVMQTVAKIVGFSETAFFTKDDKKVHIQFFTPEGEVDLCGHATVAAFSALERDSTFEMHTKKSILTVATDSTGRVTMDQDLPSFEEPDPNVIPSVPEALGLTIDDVCFDEIPLMIVSTGLPDLFVAVKSREVLNQILRPDISTVSVENGSIVRVSIAGIAEPCGSQEVEVTS